MIKKNFLKYYKIVKKSILNFLHKSETFLKENIDKIRRYLEILEKTNMSVLYLLLIIITISIKFEKTSDTILFLYQSAIRFFLVFLFLIMMFYTLSNKNNTSKLYKNIALILNFIISFSIPFTYTVLNYSHIISILPGSKIGSSDGWLSFIGSIIGGFLSMIALFFIIKHERNQNDLLFSQQIMPILICENDKENLNSTLYGLLNIKLDNVSNNLLLNLKLNKILVSTYPDLISMKMNNSNFSSKTLDNSFVLKTNVIKPNSNQYLGNIRFKEPDAYFRDTRIKYVNVIYYFSYTDIYSKNTYYLDYKLNIITQNTKNNVGYIDDNDVEIIVKDFVLITQSNKHKYESK